MTEIAMTTEERKPNKFAMAISFLMALPLATVLLLHPAMMLDANGHYNHTVLMLVMIGISGGFIYGVGFLPRFWLWKWLFSPYVACPLMLWGYYTWFLT
ncbi:cyd operon YbgE family protein [Acinetobacter sichuanensis]|uniref:Cyd operon YbgE family protein n=1 Tax=Acinetobacter sichuanensis TaxID=2136183 RepID=A0A371YNW0_9GAMM|nr:MULTISPECIES: cyd operon YbgE family protein [Acinetobacter]MDM1247594.1 cyd operon YbgE family protein [Acinetobacter sp. R933-2]MDM1765321.1 cyd operon YbgE family protein [Acinetobacter sp. 226-1]MDM1768826.1 cyd operon YbgE family protein [Acinetobacter sp. 226-4]RFC83149.1 cytochrome bd biosynthesis protein [Acinetobacter sichuanensis]